ncbi:MAG: hypothetical protein ACI9KS_002314, partial [Sulfitobacter sp.]
VSAHEAKPQTRSRTATDQEANYVSKQKPGALEASSGARVSVIVL